MKHLAVSGLILLPFLFMPDGVAQDSLLFRGELSGYSSLNPQNRLSWWIGGRYIPELNIGYGSRNGKLLDATISLNLSGNMGIHPFDSVALTGSVNPYRLWWRFSTRRLEIRAGLQKITFGSAVLVRPLMWFDEIDPRDPLGLTDGVWGLMGRYYFQNNLNIWLWVLCGNNGLKGWETFPTAKGIPEFGGRIQVPVTRGEAALSYHHRVAWCPVPLDSTRVYHHVPENRVGFDARFDMTVGWWIEGAWSHYNDDLGPFSDQELITLGADYTFGIGNGLTVVLENLVVSMDRNPFEFFSPTLFTLTSLSYPIGLFDQIGALVYCDWTHSTLYSFATWQRQFNKLTIFVMGYMNPKEYLLPARTSGNIYFGGYGVQLMLVYYH